MFALSSSGILKSLPARDRSLGYRVAFLGVIGYVRQPPILGIDMHAQTMLQCLRKLK